MAWMTLVNGRIEDHDDQGIDCTSYEGGGVLLRDMALLLLAVVVLHIMAWTRSQGRNWTKAYYQDRSKARAGTAVYYRSRGTCLGGLSGTH